MAANSHTGIGYSTKRTQDHTTNNGRVNSRKIIGIFMFRAIFNI
jgi:hypothetical protein